ncbi:nucleoside diphosphate-linked moiety X motif 8-like [Eurytemora carolleeae]|uniref:nucleoside diphosphate-linked moiety X motif 8-like n=1 Tax=Eurytemora carolleeae TaxID=1294199 RepID=UPI000C777AF4|nr:nucleoside diphosphate-linked moiety X motif 8-like [Eurytemora carolleeae]|eukprot:XP_023331851.1 nucleoside diphosphate-linked moiety X motif 8-like [Eurytemora affinis]
MNTFCSFRVRSFSSISFDFHSMVSGERKQACIKRLEKIKPLLPVQGELLKTSAVLIPIVNIENEPALLYTKRSKFLSSHRGQVSFPGGNSDKTDTSPVDTALRECWEEIGIPREQVDVWGTLPSLSSTHRGDHATVPVIGIIHDFHPEQLNINHDEVEEVFCVKFSKLSDPAVYGYTQFRLEGGPGYSLPLYNCTPHPVWGLTAIMTFQFLRSILPSQHYKHRIHFQSNIKKL